MKTEQLIADFFAQIDAATSFESRFDFYRSLVENLGYDGALYTYIPSLLIETQSQLAPIFITSNGYKPEFIDHYFEAELHHHDYTIRSVSQGASEPLDWWQDHAKGTLSENEFKVIEIARQEYGITNGMTLPLMAGVKGIAGVSVISTELTPRYLNLQQQSLATLVLCSRLFNLIVLQNRDHYQHFMPFLSRITEKERQLLRFLVTGKPLKTIGDHTDIGYGYAARHLLSGLRKKLGNISRDQLLYYAGLYGLLEYR